MDAVELLARLPAAEAALRLLHHVLESQHLDQWYEQNRGRSYQRVLAFSELVTILRDCLLANTSVHQHWSRHDDLGVTAPAFHQKLGRIPVELSERFLADTTARLAELVDIRPQRTLPATLADLRPLVIDARTIKHAAKRLKPTRTQPGAALGGKTLAALDPATGLLVAMAANADADANETTRLDALLRQLPTTPERPVLIVADRQYGDLTQPRRMLDADAHFLVRLPKRLTFQADSARPARHYTDADGRAVIEEWGTLGRDHSLTVRRLTIKRSRPADDLVAATSLLDGDRHPALDLLELYRERWTIETVFHDVVTVFGLERLIGGRPLAMVFQASFCMLLYNVIQGLRQLTARTQAIEPQTISPKKMFDGIRRSLTALNELLTPDDCVSALAADADAAPADVRRRLEELLGRAWHPYWLKREKRESEKKPRSPRPRKFGGHFSIQRILDADKARKRAERQRKDV